MKIRISNIPNTYNNGSLMMAVNTIEYLSKTLPDVEFYTDAMGEEHVKRIRDSLESHCAIRGIDGGGMGIASSSSRISGIKKRLKNAKQAFKILKTLYFPLKVFKLTAAFLLFYIKKCREYKKEDCYARIVLGGDDISLYYGSYTLCMHLLDIRAYAKRNKLFLIGQTMGPFNAFYKAAVRWAMKNAIIYTRELPNYEYLKQDLKLPNVKYSSDLAYLDLPYQKDRERREKIFNQYGIEENRYITIVPSGLVNAYTRDLEAYIDNYAKIITCLLEDERFRNLKIVLLSHVPTLDELNDSAIIRRIAEKVDRSKSARIVCVTEKLIPVYLRYILGGGMLTVTARMHAAVSTFQMGKPAVSLSYSIKYAGVIGKELDMYDTIVDAADSAKWENMQIATEVLIKVNGILNHYETIKRRIIANMHHARKRAMVQIEEICEDLGAEKSCLKTDLTECTG